MHYWYCSTDQEICDTFLNSNKDFDVDEFYYFCGDGTTKIVDSLNFNSNTINCMKNYTMEPFIFSSLLDESYITIDQGQFNCNNITLKAGYINITSLYMGTPGIETIGQ